uniref:hypothetical protein n=1 Tax=Streptosporangium sp. CA-235898 TaxID=3240073 RepID=UPI003F494463
MTLKVMKMDWLMTLPDLAPPYWVAVGAAAVVSLLVLFWLVKRKMFPKRQLETARPRRSLADFVTRVCAVAALIVAGEGIFEVISRAAPDVPWLPWLGIGLLEGPLLAFALRGKELIAAGRHEEAGQAIRMTWLLASMSAVISATAALSSGDPGVSLLRAAAPIVGVILWHDALRIEQKEHGRRQRESRWKWTPEYLLTRLGLLTARSTETVDAEVHMRLTKVADAVIRYARAAARNTPGDSGWNDRWNTFRRWRMERVYRSAERDLDLTRNTERRALMEQIIVSRSDAVLLTTLAGATRADLGLPEVEQLVEQPARNTRIVFHAPVEQTVRNTRILFHKEVVEHPVERSARTTRIVFHKPVERPGRADRNTPGTERRDTSETAHRSGGTPNRNTRNSSRGTDDNGTRNGRNTPDRNTDGTAQNSDGKPTREQIDAVIAANISPLGEIPVRALAKDLGVPASTMSRHVTRYRGEHGLPPAEEEADEIVPAPRAEGNGHTTPDDMTRPLASAVNGSTN